jgi:hypothetical protein
VTRQVFRYLAATGVLMLVGCGLVGCRSGTVEKARDSSVSNLKAISKAYIAATHKLERPPRNLEELAPFLKQFGEPAEIIRSPHDGQDYTILFGVDYRSARDQGNAFVVLAYEKEGTGGLRYVGGFRKIKRMTAEEFRGALFPPGHAPPG